MHACLYIHIHIHAHTQYAIWRHSNILSSSPSPFLCINHSYYFTQRTHFHFFFVSSCAVTAFVKHVLHLTLNQPLLKLTNTHSSQLTKPAKCTERTDNLEWEQRHKKYSCLGNWHPAIHFYVIYAETCQILQAIHTLCHKSCPSLLPSHWCHILYLPGELA